jgi:hypothetical protein
MIVQPLGGLENAFSRETRGDLCLEVRHDSLLRGVEYLGVVFLEAR